MFKVSVDLISLKSVSKRNQVPKKCINKCFLSIHIHKSIQKCFRFDRDSNYQDYIKKIRGSHVSSFLFCTLMQWLVTNNESRRSIMCLQTYKKWEFQIESELCDRNHVVVSFVFKFCCCCLYIKVWIMLNNNINSGVLMVCVFQFM